jgi:hypothetical protein
MAYPLTGSRYLARLRVGNLVFCAYNPVDVDHGWRKLPVSWKPALSSALSKRRLITHLDFPACYLALYRRNAQRPNDARTTPKTPDETRELSERAI